MMTIDKMTTKLGLIFFYIMTCDGHTRERDATSCDIPKKPKINIETKVKPKLSIG